MNASDATLSANPPHQGPTSAKTVEGSGLDEGKRRLTFFLSMALLCAALFIGWQIRNEYLIDAEYGLGYALGISGGVMMLALLIYPLRKRFAHTRLFIFSTPAWFRIHMFLGLAGPLCILYHCNFGLGSVNSNVALVSMLLMVSSGLFGRFLYSRIHLGLYGQKAKLSDLLNHKMHLMGSISDAARSETLHIPEEILEEIKNAGQQARPDFSNRHRLQPLLSLTISTHLSRRRICRNIRKSQTDLHNTPFEKRIRTYRQRKAFDQYLAGYFSIIRKIAGLNYFERLFSLWHMLHMPIFFMLIVSALIHVYAVHAY